MICKNYYMSGNQKKKYIKLEKTYKKEVKLGVKQVPNGIILPAKKDESDCPKLWAIGGVVDQEFHFVNESDSGYLFGGNYEIDEDYVNYIDEEVIFFGPYIQHWGHFICDQISRLWYIIDNPQKYKIAYCGYNFGVGNTEISGNYLQLLEQLGIREEQLINIQNPTKFKNIIIPEFSFVGGNYYTEEFKKLINHITDNVLESMKNEKCPERIYFSRRKLCMDKEYGEENLENLLAKNNFEIFYPEKLSFMQQVFLINNCKFMATISGSIAHNLMFSKYNNDILIFNKCKGINNYQLVVDELTTSKVTYIDSYKNYLPILFGTGPFIIDINKYVKKCFSFFNLKFYSPKKNTIKMLMWYIKKYKTIYSNPINRMWLKSQKKSLKKA